MDKKAILKLPLKGFSSLRNLHYFMQFQTMMRLTSAVPFIKGKTPPKPKKFDREEFENLLREMQSLADQDIDNIAEGIYPVQVLKPESLLDHTLRLPKLLIDGIKVTWRRGRQQHDVFSKEAAESDELPEYYKRNFHFQTDGYLSEKSAELYEHQVELLFSGSADAMRRLFIKDLKTALGDHSPAQILETACGTGRAARFMRLAFPQAQITATDLSFPYLKVAQKKLHDLKNINFIQADATQLQFKDSVFDVVYNVFLFHELPRAERYNILQEAFRVLKPGGHLAIVDSLQLGDHEPFDKHLKQFPVEFHEPFYTDYIKNPLDVALDASGFEVLSERTGFLAKAIVARKPHSL